LARGAELGRFNMGSTVILLLPAGAVEWRQDLAPGRAVRMGEALGRIGAGR
jgi:phosphatidylserine decarboxylase